MSISSFTHIHRHRHSKRDAEEILVRQITEPYVHVEGPHWEPIEEVLYFVDITSQLINKYQPDTGLHTNVKIDGGPVSPLLTVQGSLGQFIVGRGRDLVIFKWDGDSNTARDVRVLATVDSSHPGNQFNDGKADSDGRIWAGTMENDGESNQASFFLFRHEDGFQPHKKLHATTSNGLAWNNDDTLLYYIDSPTRNVVVFDYHRETGEIDGRRTVINLEESGITGVPDGMTIDKDDKLWVAVWGGGVILHVDPTTGHILRTVEFPAKQVSSCVWGGRNLDVLYVTTSRKDLSAEALEQQPLAGAVFAVTGTGTRGQDRNHKVRVQ